LLHGFSIASAVALKLADVLLRVLRRREKCNRRANEKGSANGVAVWTPGPQRGCALKKGI